MFIKNPTMKKIILSLGIVLAITLTANAQPGRPSQRAPHRSNHYVPAPPPRGPRVDNIGLVRLHVNGELGIADIGRFFWHEAPKHYGAGLMAEVQTGRVFSIGLGADYYATRTDRWHADRRYYRSLPVYANIRITTPGLRSGLFVEARAGYAFPLNSVAVDNPYCVYEARGFFTGGGIGFRCYGNNISIGMNAIDVRTPRSEASQYQAVENRRVITDVYLRYSYAIPMN